MFSLSSPLGRWSYPSGIRSGDRPSHNYGFNLTRGPTQIYSPGEDENVGRPLTVVAEVVVDFGGQDQHRYPDQILKTDATG